MTKVVSDEQRLANRRNARKSTGPKSPGGKDRSARNALKHGLLAKDVVITALNFAESLADFDSLLDDLMNELKPRTLVEETLVERIATGYWRLRRAQRFESGAIRAALESPDSQTLALEKLRKELASIETRLQNQSRLDELLKLPETEHTSDQINELQILLEDFAAEARLRLLDIKPDDRLNFVQCLLSLTGDTLRRKARNLRAEIDAAQRDEPLRNARRPLTAALPDRDALLKVVRYENMLDRQIHRALSELRRIRNVPHGDTSRKKRTC